MVGYAFRLKSFTMVSYVAFCLGIGLIVVSGVTVADIREFQIAKVPSGSIVCALDESSESLTLNDVLDCALECQRSSYCGNLNYNGVNKTCDIFFDRPKCYGPSTSCVHYQIQTDQPNVGIPAENCSLPFTYGGRLYNECVVNLTGDGCNACLVTNRTLAPCMRKLSGNFRVMFATANVTISTFYTATLLLAINNWLVIQQRVDGRLLFSQSFVAYTNGFGNISSNFWLGLEKIHQLTTNAPYRLRIELQCMAEGNWFSAEYDSFVITSETSGYALNVAGYVGDAGDALNVKNNSGIYSQNGMKFSTYDKDSDLSWNTNCASTDMSGFWYNQCSYACLNCIYNTSQFNWKTLYDLGLTVSTKLKSSRMMIRTT